ncbi:MAG TPA: GNAT family N-acetyltransferase [Chitinophagaceae bacterium]|nr:GNAT family N-acetyltransferase [Chitinophagaceae bacterium]
MEFVITSAEQGDLPVMYELFEEAIRFQKSRGYFGWTGYDKAFIQSDLNHGRLFKLVEAGEMVCMFSLCYRDPLIWRDREKGDALYLHRIVLNQKFRGNRTFQKILDWAVARARDKNLTYIRMDTWAENEKIIAYYQSFGFRYLEEYTTPDTEWLPSQHRNLRVALLDWTLPPPGAYRDITPGRGPGVNG